MTVGAERARAEEQPDGRFEVEKGTGAPREHPLGVTQGVVAGVLGGTVVVLFFFGLDVLQGDPFRTPAFLADAVLGNGGLRAGGALILAFTALHYLVFAALGAGAVLLFRWAGLPQNLLLGAVYGLFVCSILFYASLLVTGARVLPAPWWPAVLAGNLLAGLTMGAYLHWVGPQPGVAGIASQLRSHETLRQGLVVGLIGAAAVALWFLVVDVVAREAFWTPGALGSALLAGARSPEEVRITLGTVLGYSALHVAAFLLVGVVASGLVEQAERFPPLVFALLLLFVVFEVFFVGIAALMGAWVLEEIAWWSVMAGNLLAAAAMGSYLWKVHPILREELRAGAAWSETG